MNVINANWNNAHINQVLNGQTGNPLYQSIQTPNLNITVNHDIRNVVINSLVVTTARELMEMVTLTTLTSIEAQTTDIHGVRTYVLEDMNYGLTYKFSMFADISLEIHSKHNGSRVTWEFVPTNNTWKSVTISDMGRVATSENIQGHELPYLFYLGFVENVLKFTPQQSYF